MPGYHEYQIVGRHVPTESNPRPKIYRMRIFAKNALRAKSKFWYFMQRICSEKVKKANGEVLSINEIFEKRPHQIKNYGILLRFNFAGPQDHANLYKEYRDTTRTGAVTQMYMDMAGRYSARAERIQIISVDTVPASKVRRESTRQFHNSKIKFPLPHRILRPSTKRFRSTFSARRPNTHFR